GRLVGAQERARVSPLRRDGAQLGTAAMTAGATARVVSTREGGVVTLTVNRPEARNALDGETVDALTAAFEAIDGDADVRCTILTGAGDRAFVAGADIKAMAGLDAAGARAFAERGHRMADLMEDLRGPIS